MVPKVSNYRRCPCGDGDGGWQGTAVCTFLQGVHNGVQGVHGNGDVHDGDVDEDDKEWLFTLLSKVSINRPGEGELLLHTTVSV